MKRKQIIKHRIEQKTAARKHSRREYWRKNRAKDTTKYNTGLPIDLASPGVPSGRLGTYIKSIMNRR